MGIFGVCDWRSQADKFGTVCQYWLVMREYAEI
jgi:hypothetical protein